MLIGWSYFALAETSSHSKEWPAGVAYPRTDFRNLGGLLKLRNLVKLPQPSS